MLPSTRRPSATTGGSASKFESSSTSCATARVASLPEPIATPMSASFSASASFTPSPVIATVWPCGLERLHHRPLLLRRDAAEHRRACSSSVGELRLVLGQRRARRPDRRRPRSPSSRAIAPTVRGSSPEITFTRHVLLGEVRERVGGVGTGPVAAGPPAATGARSSGQPRPRRASAPRASRTTRLPALGLVAHRGAQRRRAPRSRPSSTSGAPRIHAPRPLERRRRSTSRADENGHRAGRRPTAGAAGNRSRDRAHRRVGCGVGGRERRAAPPRTARSSPSIRLHPLRPTSLPSVSVPVLSMHSTSTRARPSTAGSSCTSTRCRASRTTATANASDVSSTSPSGTIATVPATAPGHGLAPATSCARSWLKNSSAAVGTIAIRHVA